MACTPESACAAPSFSSRLGPAHWSEDAAGGVGQVCREMFEPPISLLPWLAAKPQLSVVGESLSGLCRDKPAAKKLVLRQSVRRVHRTPADSVRPTKMVCFLLRDGLRLVNRVGHGLQRHPRNYRAPVNLKQAHGSIIKRARKPSKSIFPTDFLAFL